jgi:hypothetical protein
LREGREGHTIVLSNENHSIPLEYDGLSGNYLGSGTDIRVWEGTTALTYNATAASNATFNVSVLSNTNITPDPTPTTITTIVTNDTRRYGNASNITANTASIVYTIGVRDKFGNFSTYTRQQSFSAVREGAPGADGANGANGTPAVSMFLSRAGVTLFAYADGYVTGYADATGQAELYSGSTRVTESASWSRTQSTGLTGTVSNTAGTKGAYSVTALSNTVLTGTLTINASYQGQTYTSRFSVAKAVGGYQIVSSLPSTDLFEGRVVFLLSDDKLYRYTVPGGWTASVPNVDISGLITNAQIQSIANTKLTGTITSTQIGANAVTTPALAAGSVNTAQLAANSVIAGKIAALAVNTIHLAADSVTANKIAVNAITADKINVGAVTAAKINVTNLSSIKADVGILNAGTINVTNMTITGISNTALSVKSAFSGERLEISSDVIRIYDSSDVLRVKLGKLT